MTLKCVLPHVYCSSRGRKVIIFSIERKQYMNGWWRKEIYGIICLICSLFLSDYVSWPFPQTESPCVIHFPFLAALLSLSCCLLLCISCWHNEILLLFYSLEDPTITLLTKIRLVIVWDFLISEIISYLSFSIKTILFKLFSLGNNIFSTKNIFKQFSISTHSQYCRNC